MWHVATLAAAFNLVSGQSILIFIYSTYTHTHTHTAAFIWLFCSYSRSARSPYEQLPVSVNVCVCGCGVFYAKSIFNLPAEHLCKYQILTTNTCLLGSPKSSPFPHLICSSAVAFTLNCNYVWLCAYTWFYLPNCSTDTYISMRVCVFCS